MVSRRVVLLSLFSATALAAPLTVASAAEPVRDLPGQHCIVEGSPAGIIMQPKTAACFSTFAEAMYVGSGGALRLPADAHVLPHGPDALIPFGPDVWLLDRE